MVNVRRVASQVHKQAARLMKADNYMKTEPAWYGAVLDHPPLPLPPRSPPSRDRFDAGQLSRSSKQHALGTSEVRPVPVKYLEDQVRRQFFRDHPFEAFRETTLVENGELEPEHPVSGKEWTRLRQRGRNPKPEDAVKFAVSIHQHHNVSLTQAYAAAVAQFRALRAEQTIATSVAAMEAESYGARFGHTETERGFLQEEEHLKSFESRESIDMGIAIARKRWKMEHVPEGGEGQWTRGKDYQRLWQEGVRPRYTPLTTPIDAETGQSPDAEAVAASADFMELQRTDPILHLSH
ncbi:hypothetical protein PUNSTDRAFT_48903 [Punctularia strigosozonata HHB-11173 SS5]|uniref:uncharacterized protein n=1 Tax=Punctularia strigosozonata (strain HHB-11173) TaxID=741275 RepID=UPI00044183D8|nr:uncharacterized protein PUNSTDRAFT_48903 [Punctularia strigosozonata HHB-11173 SS5]EIN14040.1 hypothetical protein PUNSTDRAFT_48903 [Punctularia strigosozonata HHB-11173 SS5]